MRNNTKNRFISGFLAGVMMLNLVPVFAAAEETGLCEHHTIHENCGYVEGISGIPCAHEHTECYVLTEECVHDHVDCGYSEIPEENLCDHQCTEDSGCVTKQFLCTHEHDDGCGYREEVAEQPCAYECQQCTDMNVAAAETADYLSAQPVQTEISGTCGENLRWTLDVAGTLTILGTGDIVGNPWHEHKNEIKQVVIESGVTGIGYGAFIDCADITEITIPGTITHIEAEAFSGCSNLKSIALPDSVTTIGNCAFSKCNGLNSVTFPKSVTYIGWNVFNGCASGSITVVFEGSVPSMEGAIQSSVATAYYPIHDSAWRSYVERQLGSVITWIPNNIMRGTCGDNIEWTHDYETGVLNIFGTGAMYDYTYDNTTLTGYSHPWANFANRVNSVIISDGITSIGHNAFYECNNLKTVTIPESITALIGWTFYSCDNLKEIVFEGSAPEMSHAFANVTADVYYASDDPSWTEITKQNAGGNLTWIPISGYCGNNLLWNFDRQNGVLTINGTGEMCDFESLNTKPWVNTPWINHIEEIITIQLDNGITSIGDYAFYGCKRMTDVSIPDTVLSIGTYAFSHCESVLNIQIPSNVNTIDYRAFYFCKSITEMMIPNSVSSLGSGVFFECSNLRNIVLPDNITVLESALFYNCGNLSSIIIPDGVTTVGSAFSGCTSLENITFLGDVPKFAYDTFSEVTAMAYYPANNVTWTSDVMQNYGGTITWVSYGEEHVHKYDVNHKCECGAYGGSCGENLIWVLDADGILTISGAGVMNNFDSDSLAPWDNCRNLIKSVVVEEGVTTVGYGAFTEYQELRTLRISSTVSEMSLHAIRGCDNLECVTVASDSETYLSDNGILFNKNKTALLKYPAAKTDNFYTIPDTVTTIEEYAFYGCSNLNNVFFGNSVSTIGFQAFVGCSGMLNLNIPDSVTTIDATAFADCTSLSVANIGSGIKYLNNYVFENCTSLHIVLLPETLEEIWENAFAHCSSLKRIELPAGMNFISDGAFHDCTALEEIVINGVKEFYWSLENCTALKTVIFTSDAPDYCTDAFQTLTLIAYYPAGNSTWTDAKRQSFGGNITWIATDSSGNCGENLTWSFNEGTLTISGTGDMYDYSQNQTNLAPWTHLGDYIKKLIIEEGVTSIGDYAFDCCTGLKKTFIPQSISRVGTFAFANVTDARFEINQTVRQWSKIQEETQYFPCWEHTSFVNPAPIVASGLYGEHVFWELDDQGDMVFFGSGDMYDFGAVPTLWGEQSVKSVTIEEGITRIGIGAFEVSGVDIFSKTFESVTIPSTVTSIGGVAFSNCKALKEIVFSGDAPVFDLNPFNGVTATAYYPAGNETWTTAVMQDYEGDITWEAYCIDHIFGEWIDKDNTSSRTCTLCGYTEHKVTTDSGDVEIEIPGQSDLKVEVVPVLPSEEIYILVEEAVNNSSIQDQAILKVFDINLTDSKGDHVQPSGTVKVKLPLDRSQNGNYKVYRVNDDGTLTNMNAYQQNSDMVFETDHFSLYVIVEEGHRHDYQKVVTAPDCAEAGFTTYTCGCGSSYIDDEVAALGHSYDRGKVTTKPTCMAEGIKTYTCGTCGDTKTEPVEKDPKNHSFTKYESDKNATCKKNGTKTAKCDHGCGKTDTVTDNGSKLGHKYQGDKCVRCGATKWNPDTGDKIMIAVTVLIISGSALLVLLFRKKRK